MCVCVCVCVYVSYFYLKWGINVKSEYLEYIPRYNCYVLLI